MKIKKILAGLAAAAVAVSAMAVNTFALSTKDYLKDGVVYINADKPEDPTWAIDAGVALTDVYGVTFHVTFGDAEWYGGGIGTNSPSTGWAQTEWGTNSKDITADVENGTITLLKDAPVFTADDIYAQFWLQTWSGADSLTIVSADVLGAGGTILSTEDAAPAAEEDTSTADAAEAQDDSTADVADDVDIEDIDVDDVDVDDDEDVDIDFDDDTDDDTYAVADTTEDAPAAETASASTAAPATGNVAVASIAAVMAVAGAAALASRKRK